MAPVLDCRKFSPNIFNKNKCSNCYRVRDQHSDAALDVNKASRRISRCGYLFAAPNWDFTNPIYRTKRWQRRFFILYDDGELRYSLDENVDTVPQAIINLNTVFEITEADAITGNENSIAIVAQDGIHFVKGSCAEESRLWLDILRLFPQSTCVGRNSGVGGGAGRSKRSATFPGLPIGNTTEPGRDKLVRQVVLKCEVDETPGVESEDEEGVENISTLLPDVLRTSAASVPDAKLPVHRCALAKRSTTMSSFVSSNTKQHNDDDEKDSAKDGWLGGSNVFKFRRYDSSASLLKRNDDDDHRSSGLSRRISNLSELRYKPLLDIPTPKVSYTGHIRDNVESKAKDETMIPIGYNRDIFSSQFRGVPDGCGLEMKKDLPVKKGWLMRRQIQVDKEEWIKHWFVLQNSSLMYYKDPSAENNGFLDGSLDLGTVEDITELDVSRNYGFRVEIYTESFTLSAVTSGIRRNWICALRDAAGMKNQVSKRLTDNLDGNTKAIEITKTLTEKEADEIQNKCVSSSSRGDFLDHEIDSLKNQLEKSQYDLDMDISSVSSYVAFNKNKIHLPSTPTILQSKSEDDGSNDKILEIKNLMEKTNVLLAKQCDTIHCLTNRLTSYQFQIEANETLIADERAQRERMETELCNRETDLSKVRADLANTERDLDDVRSRLSDTCGEIELLRLSSEANILKWKDLYESLYLQYNSERHENIQMKETVRLAQEGQAIKEKLIQDLSEQLGESQERIHDLLGDQVERRDYENKLDKLKAAKVGDSDMIETLRSEKEQLERVLLAKLDELEEVNTMFAKCKNRNKMCGSMSELIDVPVLPEDATSLSKQQLLSFYFDLWQRFLIAIGEIRSFRVKLREAHSHSDDLELGMAKMEQDSVSALEHSELSQKLMSSRIQDLTQKLSNSEKTVRLLKVSKKQSKNFR